MATGKATRKRKANSLTAAEQHTRFVEAAKKAEADESPDALDKAFKKISLRDKRRANDVGS